MKNALANSRGIQVFRSLRHRNYRLLWGTNIITLSGYWILVTAQGWLVLQLTDSAMWVGMIAFIMGIPALFLSPFGGVYADRFDRRKLVLFGQGVSGLLILLLATLTSTGVIAIWHIAAIAVFLGTVWALTDPAYMAIIPSLVPPDDLMNAIAVNSISGRASRSIGPVIAGVLMGLVAVGGAFYGAGIAFMVGLLLLFSMRLPATVIARRASTGKTMREGLRYIRSNTIVLTLILMVAGVSLFALPYFWLMPVFARDVLGVGEAGYSQLMIVTGVGGLGGALATAILGDFKRKGWLLIGSALTFTVTLILFAMSRSFPLSLVLSTIIGGANGLFYAVTIVVLLSMVPDQLRGRVMGLYAVTWYLPSIGSLILGAATDWVGLPVAVMVSALISTVFILGAALRLPALRRL
jgi:MFS family permease